MNLNQLNIEIYNLEPQEEIKLILHKHGFFLFWIFIKFFGFLFFILIINLINFYFFLVSQVIINIFTIIYTLFCLLFLYILIIEYLLNNIVITNKKLIFLKKINFLKYEIINHKFLVIEEIGGKMKGIFANILNFGTICIKLNEQKIQINFNYITDVFNKVNLILNIIKENKI